MPRDLTAAMQASIELQDGPHVVWLMEAEFSGGTVRICTASADIDWNGATWEAVGGSVRADAINEDADSEAQGVAITLPAVDQTLVQKLLTEHTIGRGIVIWKAHLDDSTGEIVVDPMLAFDGEMNDDWAIKTNRVAGTSEIVGRAVSRVGRSATRSILRRNPESHGRFYPDDTFYEYVETLAASQFEWAGKTPWWADF